ncbi:aminotransferase class I/II-fold pyridoxal phosphate-dependent enzyme [Clostridium sp. AF19-22AC]|jgi:aspartate/methionine/tyrosine aminotransferase|uniref:Transcriptional regulator n=1 Tax=Faecalicatena orotica TaxID=1544 RepID=A0A2Y9BHH4_9FIRM|nr:MULTISPECIES: aminotransferase class I/II-fold pyridoxal phosphate-dependent enzyme [Clostridia]PWJ28015.1 transcriptional regulator [Faecalicatena orotica]RHR29983.1 aminotransferase class I/II-fold pyridoxal phosphate-dependent enzyme [Clostridium sp. AF19-22AC]SSA57038.1 transcriptional regulator [Faecalicatena orotica]
MKPIADYSSEDLSALLNDLEVQYKEAQAQNLKLNMARGKPATTQLNLSNALLDKMESYTLADGTDARNYGILDGIPECKKLFGELLGINPDQIIIGGNASLNVMFDTLSFLCLFGTGGCEPWIYSKHNGNPVKFLCPVPGYDRHFTICEELGIEMITVPLNEDGPDMDIVKKLVSEDESIKGIWCVPLHSNPQGVCYSDEVVEQLASMETAAKDFRIFWDNAYGVHHIYEDVALKDIIKECEKCGNPDRVYYFFSTSKISFPGAGIALVASSPANIKELKGHMSAQTIGHDKLNQLRHVQFFKTPENIRAHMKKLAEELKPKFDMVLDKLDETLSGSGLASWSNPKGGYFVSLDTLPGCAKRTVELAKNAGVTLTGAGATYPYGKDPKDSNIRIAPTYPTIDELEKAMDIFTLCVKIAGIEKLLEK